jgi:hypothetical protein
MDLRKVLRPNNIMGSRGNAVMIKVNEKIDGAEIKFR